MTTAADRLREYDKAMRENRAAFRLSLVAMEAQSKLWAGERQSDAERAALTAIDEAHQMRLTGKISINDCEERCRAAIVRAEAGRGR